MRRMRRVYTRFTRLHASFEDVAYESKKLIMDTALASELNLLAHAIDRIGERNRKARDFTLNSIRDALVETVACFPTYRTYINARRLEPRGPRRRRQGDSARAPAQSRARGLGVRVSA